MKLLKKYKEQILYILFGGLTTLINIIAYQMLFVVMSYSNTFSNVVSLIISVLFAYITNKFYVFESKDNSIKTLLREILSFFSCRAITGIIDIFFMFICVDILFLPALIMKIISNVFVIVVNYVFSKLFVFKGERV